MKESQDLLAASYDDPPLGSMAVGDTAWTPHWAMWVDLTRRCWLNLNYPARQFEHNWFYMRVERRDDGYHVWVPANERVSWTQEAKPPLGMAVEAFVPLAELHGSTGH